VILRSETAKALFDLKRCSFQTLFPRSSDWPVVDAFNPAPSRAKCGIPWHTILHQVLPLGRLPLSRIYMSDFGWKQGPDVAWNASIARSVLIVLEDAICAMALSNPKPPCLGVGYAFSITSSPIKTSHCAYSPYTSCTRRKNPLRRERRERS